MYINYIDEWPYLELLYFCCPWKGDRRVRFSIERRAVSVILRSLKPISFICNAANVSSCLLWGEIYETNYRLV